MTHLLDEHGTKLNVLRPGAIIAAAAADLRRREGNRGAIDKPPGREHYAFHRVHVCKSKFVIDLLAVAQRDRQRGIGSGKRWTRLIYGDGALLAQAVEMARPGLSGDQRE